MGATPRHGWNWLHQGPTQAGGAERHELLQQSLRQVYAARWQMQRLRHQGYQAVAMFLLYLLAAYLVIAWLGWSLVHGSK
jgi:hypothetical protein